MSGFSGKSNLLFAVNGIISSALIVVIKVLISAPPSGAGDHATYKREWAGRAEAQSSVIVENDLRRLALWPGPRLPGGHGNARFHKHHWENPAASASRFMEPRRLADFIPPS